MAATQISPSPLAHHEAPSSANSERQGVPVAPRAPNSKRTKADLHQLHALPVPIRTFPLPAFYPSNPLSLVHLVYAWVNQLIFTPREPAAVHEGIWSPQFGAVLVKDAVSIRALWEQGFYGKGHLSRSEPEWFRQEQVRQGLVEAHVSHLITTKRREERKAKKWERAKAELEALRQVQLREAKLREEAELREAERREAEHQEAERREAERREAERREAERREAELEAKLQEAQLREAQLREAELQEARLREAQLREAELREAREENAIAPPVGPLELLALPNSLPTTPTEPAEPAPPVGPLELLALPNSLPIAPEPAPVRGETKPEEAELREAREETVSFSPVGPLELLALPNSVPTTPTPEPAQVSNGQVAEAEPSSPRAATDVNTHANGSLVKPQEIVNGDKEPSSPPRTPPRQAVKRQKSVRFSPEVKSTTVDLSLPPSPELAALNGNGHVKSNGLSSSPEEQQSRDTDDKDQIPSKEQISEELGELVDKEHLQLTREEAFFLSFGLGALKVIDEESQKPIAARDLFELFRRYSYIPPQEGPAAKVLRPDDRFLLDYTIYHHFRSLGWVPRAGIKFGVDWLLYFKGPAFDHAQYGIIVMPSYSHPWWKEHGHRSPEKDWAWFHRVSRTLANVLKTIVLAYVDIPPPPVFEEALDKGITDVLQLYTVREIIAKRFNPNRERKA